MARIKGCSFSHLPVCPLQALRLPGRLPSASDLLSLVSNTSQGRSSPQVALRGPWQHGPVGRASPSYQLRGLAPPTEAAGRPPSFCSPCLLELPPRCSLGFITAPVAAAVLFALPRMHPPLSLPVCQPCLPSSSHRRGCSTASEG